MTDDRAGNRKQMPEDRIRNSVLWYRTFKKNGEGGIRTRGTQRAHRFSKPARSATPTPLRNTHSTKFNQNRQVKHSERFGVFNMINDEKIQDDPASLWVVTGLFQSRPDDFRSKLGFAALLFIDAVKDGA